MLLKLEHRAEDVKALEERLAQNEVDVYDERQAMVRKDNTGKTLCFFYL